LDIKVVCQNFQNLFEMGMGLGGWGWKDIFFSNMSTKLDDKTYFWAPSFFKTFFFSKINKCQTLGVGPTNG